MNRAQRCAGAILIGLLVPIYTQPVMAEDFTGQDLLRESKASQYAFVSTSIGMATMIAGQKNRNLSECIARWYWDDPRGDNARNDEILSVVAKLPDYPPQATLLAVIEKACGAF